MNLQTCYLLRTSSFCLCLVITLHTVLLRCYQVVISTHICANNYMYPMSAYLIYFNSSLTIGLLNSAAIQFLILAAICSNLGWPSGLRCCHSNLMGTFSKGLSLTGGHFRGQFLGGTFYLSSGILCVLCCMLVHKHKCFHF